SSKKSEKIIFFDEPVLSQIGSAVLNLKKEEIKSIYEDIIDKKTSYFTGMHICGNSEWDFIMSLPVNIVNFDAYNYSEEFFLYKDSIKRFIRRGGFIAFGIVPTDSDLLNKTSLKDIKELTDYIEKKLIEITDYEKIYERVFYTPSCGMGSLNNDETFRVLDLLKSLK
ncbi:MAG: hypothetical protein N2999_04300, partial [Proteobacteria bacterium]|nr:hypothetical protein [Pseudomonadota bacterium]